MNYLYIVIGILAGIWLVSFLVNREIIALPPRINRVGHIDGVRGYLAFAVMGHHFFIWTNISNGGRWAPPDVNFIVNLGQVGVSIFFMVTGALFYAKICENPLKVDWVKLYISRFFRLTPLMAFAAVIMFLIAAIKSGHAREFYTPPQVEALLKWVFFLGQPKLFNLDDTGAIIANVTWSLRYEWEFYLSLPIVGLVFYNLSRLGDRKHLLLFFLLLSYVLLHLSPEFAGHAATFAPLFLTGMLASELRTDHRLVEKFAEDIASVIGLVALFGEMFCFKGAFGAPQFFLLALFFVPVVCGNSYFGLFSNRGSVHLGEISYSIYLLHGIILYLIFGLYNFFKTVGGANYDIGLLFPIVVILCIVVTTMTYKCIELPGIGIGRAFSRNRFNFLRGVFAAQE
jgi:peptidoglycan/LPS O-acetylase OafA/YrhL